jgi:hypothetical protein
VERRLLGHGGALCAVLRLTHHRQTHLALAKRDSGASGLEVRAAPVVGVAGAAQLADRPDPEGGQRVDEVAAVGAVGLLAVRSRSWAVPDCHE